MVGTSARSSPALSFSRPEVTVGCRYPLPLYNACAREASARLASSLASSRSAASQPCSALSGVSSADEFAVLALDQPMGITSTSACRPAMPSVGWPLAASARPTRELQEGIELGMKPLRDELRTLVECMAARTEHLEDQVTRVETALEGRVAALESKLDSVLGRLVRPAPAVVSASPFHDPDADSAAGVAGICGATGSLADDSIRTSGRLREPMARTTGRPVAASTRGADVAPAPAPSASSATLPPSRGRNTGPRGGKESSPSSPRRRTERPRRSPRIAPPRRVP